MSNLEMADELAQKRPDGVNEILTMKFGGDE